ncbi:iron-siderophore ABC transporter substrate-binding protein [Jidongwangia harbinensis]|uniref:iron-siderophore ABC transporter substrate-binding protein n=1 Tax=Jidongwangia harbinensis TaxID=2878561 RepID=UPI001CD98C49|nr:iron-siderophore ABC transporter substrate-binding protein [Jidongwangia harbinensis]MCA2215605.1 iron-siderophore ABC transporter substrate-binding protein [Jidongwangia harbinensis]
MSTVAAVALALTLGACGGDSGASTPAAGASSAAGTAFPVTIAHKYGSTTIEKAPTRVVTLGLSDHDAVLALGVVPVGVVDWFGERPYGNWPWVKDRWGGTPPQIVGERDEYQTEKIIALKPDLIVAQYSGMTQAQYTTLSKVAPVVAQIKEFPDYAAPWKDMSLVIGRALGQEPAMTKLLGDIDKRFADVRAQHAAWAGKTAAVTDASEPGTYAAFAKSDPKAQLLADMGFKLAPAVDAAAGKETAAVLSAERLDILDVDQLVVLTGDGTVEPRVRADKAFAALNVAKNNRVVFVPYMEPPIGAALSFVTVLSVPYAIDQLVPMLAKTSG